MIGISLTAVLFALALLFTRRVNQNLVKEVKDLEFQLDSNKAKFVKIMGGLAMLTEERVAKAVLEESKLDPQIHLTAYHQAMAAHHATKCNCDELEITDEFVRKPDDLIIAGEAVEWFRLQDSNVYSSVTHSVISLKAETPTPEKIKAEDKHRNLSYVIQNMGVRTIDL